jgi:4-aminobutyrate aminotransferase-like enzyme/Ser/Thr protein kinase RdoA (MazF antagonist)
MSTPADVDDRGFTAPPPDFTLERLGEFAREHYAITGELVPLASERDQNARIAGLVLKVANVDEDPGVLHLQHAALAHLEAVAPGVAVPRLVRTRDAADTAVVHGVQGQHLLRCVTHLPGRPLASVPRTPDIERELGVLMGSLSAGLRSFGHPAAHRSGFLWDLDAAQRVRPWLADVAADDRDVVEWAFDLHERLVVPRLGHLRTAVVHGDANDHNVLVHDGHVSGLIDFGDMAAGRQVNELAITLAYALLDQPDLVASATRVIEGYTSVFELEPAELAVLFPLVAARLAMSVAISFHRSRDFPDNEYLLVSQAPALRLLRRLQAIRPQFLHFAARRAAGLAAVPQHDAIVAWLRSQECRPVGPMPFDLGRAGRIVISLADGAPGMDVAGDPDAYWAWLQGAMADAGATVAIGRYDEDRSCYAGDQFVTDAPETRSVHLGIDLFVPADTEVRAMLDGVVETVVDNDLPFDYGPTVIVRHTAGEAGPFWCLYGHLSRRTLTTVEPGEVVRAGQVVGFVGDPTVNGGWAPHVHVQLITDLMVDPLADPGTGPDGNFEGAGEPSRMDVWRQIAPDANLLLRFAPETFASAAEPDELVARRTRDLGASLSTSYRRKLHVVRGAGVHLFDHTGRAHLDCVNNVCHVGHAHPHVVEALARQAATLNTNTRYLHPTVLDYAERLAATFPGPLEVVYFTNSGSEANELALRLARTVTRRYDVMALDWGYHGNTNDLVEISAYKFDRRGGAGRPAFVHLVDLPDPYRGGRGHGSIADAIARARAHDDRGPAAFIAESISGCGGQVVFPLGFLADAYAHAHEAGALCIADEVQVGFGRVGSAMWAFELQGVVPDIVTLGKPIGNGHPLGAVVTTRAIADAFANGMEWFNTFGGNPVSCAVGMAVLDVIDDEDLQANALHTGSYLVERLRRLADRHEAIGDVRGEGLYLGVDLVLDRATKEPATALAGDVLEAMRERAVLVSSDGPFDNVLKIKPPIVFSRADADVLADTLDEVLGGLS